MMPTESIHSTESNGKRKVKNKLPKRLRRKNKPADVSTEENSTDNIPNTDYGSIPKAKYVQESAPFLLNTPPSHANLHSIFASTDKTSIHYWKNCAKKAVDVLEKQASNRRKFFIERHQERIDSVQCLLNQREQLNKLTEENHSMFHSLNSLRNELRTKDELIKTVEEKLCNRDDLIRDNDFLRVQLKLTEQKFDRFTMEYSQKLDENRQHEDEYSEQIQSLMDEIERIKRDLVLEEYRKQEAERKVRYYDERSKIEQNLNKKMQQDILQLKQDLKSIHLRYDSLQIEMLAMHKANNNEISLIPTKDTGEENTWTRKRTIEHESDEGLESQGSKRKTRARTESSASTASNSSNRRRKITMKSSKNKDEDHDPAFTVKRKTLKTKKTMKIHLPMLTVTQASPSVDQTLLIENDSSQLLLPPSVSATSDGSTPTTDSPDTSSESQPVKPRTKKQSRYPCRRAQRPVKQIDTSDQVKQ